MPAARAPAHLGGNLAAPPRPGARRARRPCGARPRRTRGTRRAPAGAAAAGPRPRAAARARGPRARACGRARPRRTRRACFTAVPPFGPTRTPRPPRAVYGTLDSAHTAAAAPRAAGAVSARGAARSGTGDRPRGVRCIHRRAFYAPAGGAGDGPGHATSPCRRTAAGTHSSSSSSRALARARAVA